MRVTTAEVDLEKKCCTKKGGLQAPGRARNRREGLKAGDGEKKEHWKAERCLVSYNINIGILMIDRTHTNDCRWGAETTRIFFAIRETRKLCINSHFCCCCWAAIDSTRYVVYTAWRNTMSAESCCLQKHIVGRIVGRVTPPAAEKHFLWNHTACKNALPAKPCRL